MLQRLHTTRATGSHLNRLRISWPAFREEFEESGAHALPPVEAACDVQCHTLTGWRQFGTWPALPSVSAANLAVL
eukprot:3827038-Amphidinium_carterae.3